MVQLRHVILIWVLVFIRVCGGRQIADTNKLVSAVDRDSSGNVTLTEVQNFYNTLAGGSGMVSRCGFAAMMERSYDGTPSYVSALYDVMQSTDGQTLSEMELRVAFLGNVNITVVSETTFRNNLQKLRESVEKILSKPNDSPTGPTFWGYTDFDVTKLTNFVDRNKNNIISRAEVTGLILSLDQNGDYRILRCEFVQGMLQYRQHAVTASNFYDILFSSRDLSWAPIDSDFIMAAMDYNADGRVSKAELARYLTEKNFIAARAGVHLDDGVMIMTGNSVSRLQLSFLCMMMSSLLGLLFLYG